MQFSHLGPLRGRGGVKPNFADKIFMDTQTFLNLSAMVTLKLGCLQEEHNILGTEVVCRSFKGATRLGATNLKLDGPHLDTSSAIVDCCVCSCAKLPRSHEVNCSL